MQSCIPIVKSVSSYNKCYFNWRHSTIYNECTLVIRRIQSFNGVFVMYWEIYRLYQFCTYTFQDRSEHRILTGPRHFSMVYLELTLFVLVITENKLLLFFIISNFSRYLLIKSLHNKDRPANFFSRDNQKKTFEKYTSEKKKWLYFQPILT